MIKTAGLLESTLAFAFCYNNILHVVTSHKVVTRKHCQNN